ncbi:MAG: glycosyltransferase family protein [Promethearchaeota archaeon]
MTKKIVFYLSSYGFGHATRMIPIIHALLSRSNFEIFVKTTVPEWLLMNSFSEKDKKKVRYEFSKNDVGVRNTPTLQIDILETSKAIKQMIHKKQEFIAKELKFCQKNEVDMIICDIPPLPFLVAKEIGIHGIGISNFNWYDNYEYVYQKKATDLSSPSLEIELEEIKAAYNLADLFLELPFATQNNIFRNKLEIPLAVRKTTRQQLEIKELLNIKKDQNLIFLSLGWHDIKDARNILSDLMSLKDVKNYIFLLSANLQKYIDSQNHIRFLPSKDPNSQDYVAACDLVISKLGYGIVSECVANGIPMIYTIRENYFEDIVMGKKLNSLGMSRFLATKQFIRGNWIDLIEDAISLKESAKMKEDINGAEVCVHHILDFLNNN